MQPIEIEIPGKKEEREKRPDWLKIKVPLGTKFSELRRLMDQQRLNTVCEDAAVRTWPSAGTAARPRS